MGNRGGRTSTTMAGTWNMGETTTIRIPKALKDELMAYARARDAGECLLQGNNSEIILNAIAQYIEIRKRDRHNNQHNKDKELNLEARTWDELRRFAKLAQEQPELLGLNQ